MASTVPSLCSSRVAADPKLYSTVCMDHICSRPFPWAVSSISHHLQIDPKCIDPKFFFNPNPSAFDPNLSVLNTNAHADT